jgi:putative peptidoglycan lipid II flippase
VSATAPLNATATGDTWRAQSRGHDNRWHGVWRNATVVSGLTAVAKCAGAMKTVIIARFFGAGTDLDAYLLAFLIPSFTANVLCGAIVPALVPRLIELMQHKTKTAAMELYNGTVLSSVTFVSAVAALLALPAIIVLATHSGGQRTVLACSLLLAMLPILPLNALSNVWRATLNANRRFAIAALGAVFTPAIIILALMIAGRSVYWLAAGTTAGALAEATALGLAVGRLGIPLFEPALSRWQHGSELAVREYRSLAVTNFVLGGALFLDQSMAAMLGFGAVSVLNYGTRLVPVLIAIGPEALGITLLPRFSQMMVQGGHGQARPFLNRFLAAAMCGSAIVAGALIYFSRPIVKLVFEHGAFAAADALAVVSVQNMSLLQLPFAVGIALLSRFVASARVNRILVPISAAGLVLNAALNLLLMRRFAVAGIAMATTIAQAAVFAILLFAVSRIPRHPEVRTC